MDSFSSVSYIEGNTLHEQSMDQYANPESSSSAQMSNNYEHRSEPANHNSSRDRFKGKGQRKTKRADAKRQDETSLYYAVFSGKASLHEVVNGWIETYNEEKETAILQLIQFFINAAGCYGKVTPEMQNNMEHSAIIDKMTEYFGEDAGAYILAQKSQVAKKFHSNYCDFVQMLIKQCQNSIIFDEYLLDNIISFLAILSASNVRTFRHTATLGVMKLITALVRVALNVSSNFDKINSQYESVKLKPEEHQAADRLELLRETIEKLKGDIEEIHTILAFTFKSVFVHRYKDVACEIRSLCLAELGKWMKMYPRHFLNDSYLKYISWMMYDKSGDVRLQCLKALSPLYSDKDLWSHLELFNCKFKDHILVMTLDKVTDVSVEAIKIVTSIMNCNANALTDKDYEFVYELVYSKDRVVAKEAGKFVCEKLLSRDRSFPNLGPIASKKITGDVLFLKDILQFFVESELPDHAICLVDSFFDNCPIMKDWTCFSVLLEDDLPQEVTLDDGQESALIKILLCCITQATTVDQSVLTIRHKKQNTSPRENKQVMRERTRFTYHLAPKLPFLFMKYIADAEKVSTLLQILGYFDRRVYTNHQQQKNLDRLLEVLCEIIKKHSDTDVLENVAKSLEFLCDDDYTIYQRCDTARSSLLDQLNIDYNIARDDYFPIRNDVEMPDGDAEYAYICALKKLSIFYTCQNFNRYDVWDSLFLNISDALEYETNQPQEVIKYSIAACCYNLLWHMNELLFSGKTKNVIEDVKHKLHLFMKALQSILESSSVQIWKNLAFSSICELLVAFGLHLATNQLPILIYEADKSLIDIMNQFLLDHVFNEPVNVLNDQEKCKELHERRNLLAGFCKLITRQALPMTALTEVFKNYTKDSEDYGDIIKEVFDMCRSISNKDLGTTISLALASRFQDLKLIVSNIRRNDMEFVCLKELSRNFASLFGLNCKKNSAVMLALHKNGISFACKSGDHDQTLPPPNILFLEILIDFSSKLFSRDKLIVLEYLDEAISWADMGSTKRYWQSYFSYRKSLLKDCDICSTPAAKKVRSVKGARNDGGYDKLDIRTDISRPLHNLSLSEMTEGDAILDSSSDKASQVISEYD